MILAPNPSATDAGIATRQFAAQTALLLAGAAMLQSPVASAQSPDPPKARFEVGIGLLWVGHQPLGAGTCACSIAEASSRFRSAFWAQSERRSARN